MKKHFWLLVILSLLVFSGVWIMAQMELDFGNINVKIAPQNSPLVEALFLETLAEPTLGEFNTLELSPIIFKNVPPEAFLDEINS